jgi:hypothetical protein
MDAFRSLSKTFGDKDKKHAKEDGNPAKKLVLKSKSGNATLC